MKLNNDYVEKCYEFISKIRIQKRGKMTENAEWLKTSFPKKIGRKCRLV